MSRSLTAADFSPSRIFMGIPFRILLTSSWMHMILRIKFDMNADKNSEQIRIPNRILGADGLPGCI